MVSDTNAYQTNADPKYQNTICRFLVKAVVCGGGGGGGGSSLAIEYGVDSTRRSDRRNNRSRRRESERCRRDRIKAIYCLYVYYYV